MKERRSIKIWAVAVWLIVWEIAARLLNKEIFLVSPIKAIIRFGQLAITGGFWVSVLGSFARIAFGFLLAVLIGILLAALSAKYKRVRELFAPIMLAIRTVPIASFIILALICFSSKCLAVLISFMIALPVIYENVFTGIQEADKQLLEMARVFGLSGGKTARYFYCPEIYPYFKSACKTAVGMAWKAGIAAEVIGAPKGSIGAMLHQAKIYLETADLIAWTIGIVLLSLFMEKVVLWIVDYADASLRKLPAGATAVSHQVAGAPAVVLAGVSKSYNGQKVLNNINFTFSAGKIGAIRALSGGGKTTLLRIIAGLETADSGRVVFERLIYTGEGEGALIQEAAPKIAMAFQEDRLIGHMTAEENIRLVNESLSDEAVRTAMTAVGLNGKSGIRKPVSEYSGGMKRRVAVLRALLANAGGELGASAKSGEVILLDEPFKGLDAETKEKTIEFIKETTRGMTVILVTHDKDETIAMGAENILYL